MASLLHLLSGSTPLIRCEKKRLEQAVSSIIYLIITGRNDEEHLANLEEVLCRLQVHGLRANKTKCEFFNEKITCGHDIDSHGPQKSPEKVKAALKAPHQCNVTEMRSFLGLVNYYNKFLPNLSMEMDGIMRQNIPRCERNDHLIASINKL